MPSTSSAVVTSRTGVDSVGEEDAYNITKSVLARKRQLMSGPAAGGGGKFIQNGVVLNVVEHGISLTAAAGSVAGDSQVDEVDVQPTINKYIEAAIIVGILVTTLLRQPLDDYLIWLQLSIVVFLRFVTTVVGTKLPFGFPPRLHLWAFPVMLSFTCGPGYTRGLNQMLSLLAFIPSRLDALVVEALFVFALSPPLPTASYTVSPLELHHEIGMVISTLCGQSLTDSEVSLFSSLLVNLLFLRNSPVNTYIQSLIMAPFVSLVIVWPLFEKVIDVSKIVGSHRRPRNADSLKTWYANIIYIAFPIIALGLFTANLEINYSLGLLQFLAYIFTEAHLYMLVYWCTVLSVILPIVMKFSANWLLDLRRKVWHLCIVLMFLPVGCNIDSSFTAISMTVALVLMLSSEVVRATTLPPFGQKLHQILLNYTDGRDTSGPVIISHIFLLLGIYLPIVIAGSPIGIICLGLGDSSASTIGRRVGRLKVFGKKTLEGTLSFIIGCSLGLYACKTIIPSYSLTIPNYGIFVISSTTALLEATSGMNDNVIVPLYMLILYQLVI